MEFAPSEMRRSAIHQVKAAHAAQYIQNWQID
jgi:hypothetical protein